MADEQAGQLPLPPQIVEQPQHIGLNRTSNAVVISSAISTSGSPASARAIPIRCRCPPESCAGSRSASAGSRRTSEMSCRARIGGLRTRARRAEEPQRPPHRVTHRTTRVQRRVGVLEHKLDPPPQRQRPLPGGPGEVARPRSPDLRPDWCRPTHGPRPHESSCRRTASATPRAPRRAWTCRCPTPPPGRGLHRAGRRRRHRPRRARTRSRS